MREIKFRVYENIRKMMFYPDVIQFRKCDGAVSRIWSGHPDGGHYKFDADDKDCELIPMQFIGLLDKNGKEIYEGDILKPVPPSRKENNRHVQFVQGSFCYSLEGFLKPKYYSNLNESKCKLFEVIGNIYENSDLLN